MSRFMVEPWLHIDRDELIRECREIASTGGLLLISGNAASGRKEATQIAESFFAGNDMTVHRVLDAGNRPSTFRYMLEDVISWATQKIGAIPAGLSLSASNAAVSTGKLLNYCVDALQPFSSKSPTFAFIVTTLGLEKADPGELSQLKRLWEAVGGCWVVIGGDMPYWENISSNRINLRDFTRNEVTVALQRILHEGSGSIAQTSRHLDRIFDPGQTEIIPIVAYAHLQKLAQDLRLDQGRSA